MDIRLLTWNIRNSVADHGNLSWPARRPRLLAAIDNLEPSMILLQECLPDQMEDLKSHFAGWSIIGVQREPGGETCPILAHASLEISDAGWFMLSEQPEVLGSKSWDSACPRICTWVEVGGCRIFNTHLDHVGSTARKLGCKMMVNAAPELAIIAGDFNTHRDSDELSDLATNKFSILSPSSPTPTFHAYGQEADEIDFIFGRGIKIAKSGTLITNAPDFASDHNGLWADISL